MGQKTNPIGLRLAVNHNWDSGWFTSNKQDYSLFLNQDIQIKEYLKQIYEKPFKNDHKNIIFLVGKSNIERSNKCIYISYEVYYGSSKSQFELSPQDMEKVTSTVLLKKEETIKKTIKELTNLEVKLVPNLVSYIGKSADLVASYVALGLENREPFRNILKRTLDQLKKYPTLYKGIKIDCSGRLNGVDIARTESIKEGRVPLNSLNENIDYGVASAQTIYGVCGVKVWICYN